MNYVGTLILHERVSGYIKYSKIATDKSAKLVSNCEKNKIVSKRGVNC